jgi:VWFA-related protein
MRPILILLSALAVLAQDQKRDLPSFQIGVSVVRVDAQVLESGEPLAGLAQDDFAVYDEGVRQKITYFGRDSEPLSLVLLLDISGSMTRFIDQMAASARAAVEHLKPADRVAVMLFSRRSKVTQELTDDHDVLLTRLKEAVKEDDLGSGTEINSALLESARYLKESASDSGRRAVLIVTDNNDVNYKLPDDYIISQLHEANAVLNAIVVGKAKRPPPAPVGKNYNPDFTPADVFRIAEETGGETVNTERAAGVLPKMFERIRTRYSLHYKAPPAPPGQMRRIRVELNADARWRHPDSVVRARSGYRVAR